MQSLNSLHAIARVAMIVGAGLSCSAGSPGPTPRTR